MTSLDIKNLTFPPNCPKKLTCSLAKQRTNPLKPGLSVNVYCNILDHTAVAILKCLDTYMLSYMYWYETNMFRDGIISLSWYITCTLTCHEKCLNKSELYNSLMEQPTALPAPCVHHTMNTQTLIQNDWKLLTACIYHWHLGLLVSWESWGTHGNQWHSSEVQLDCIQVIQKATNECTVIQS